VVSLFLAVFARTKVARTTKSLLAMGTDAIVLSALSHLKPLERSAYILSRQIFFALDYSEKKDHLLMPWRFAPSKIAIYPR
jgi:hypothetical protein